MPLSTFLLPRRRQIATLAPVSGPVHRPRTEAEVPPGLDNRRDVIAATGQDTLLNNAMHTQYARTANTRVTPSRHAATIHGALGTER